MASAHEFNTILNPQYGLGVGLTRYSYVHLKDDNDIMRILFDTVNFLYIISNHRLDRERFINCIYSFFLKFFKTGLQSHMFDIMNNDQI
jgi:hypothetical protein